MHFGDFENYQYLLQLTYVATQNRGTFGARAPRFPLKSLEKIFTEN